MRFDNLRKIMYSDHDSIECMIKIMKSGEQVPETTFMELKQKLKRYFQWKGRIPFPVFDKKSGFYGGNIVFMLQEEYRHLKKTFFTAIEKEYSDNKCIFKIIFP